MAERNSVMNPEQSSPNLIDGSEKTSMEAINCLIAGDTYDGLRHSFFATGKGRRPNPPVVPHTYRLLIMLHTLRVEGQRTVSEMSLRFLKLFPDVAFPPDRLHKLISRILDKALSLRGPALMSYLNTPLQLNVISPALDNIGINRVNILASADWSFKPLIVTNAVVIDLEQFRNKERLKPQFVVHWIIKLLGCEPQSDNPFYEQFNCAVKRTCNTYSTLLKKGRNNLQMQDFLSETFSVESTPRPKDNVETVKQNVCECSSLISALRAERVQLIHNNAFLDADYKSLHKRYEIEKCLSADLTKRNEKLMIDFDNYKIKMTQDLKTSTHKSKHQSDDNLLKSRISILKQSIKRSSAVNSKLRKQVLNEQKRSSKLKMKFNRLKIKVADLQQLQDHSLEDMDNVKLPLTIKENSKNAFSNDIRETCIALQCQTGVAAHNVCKVIDIVAMGIFHYSISNLPSKSSAIRFCDEGHALSNMQVCEKMLESSDVTLHADGTSRDQKKIVSHQVTMSDGETLYLGFLPVASEDSNTLLDITLNLFKNLSNCYAQLSNQSSEQILRDVLCKITSTMTDRAACMKLFDKKLEQFLKSELGQGVKVHFLHCNAHFLLGLSSSSEKGLKAAEKEQIELNGETLGRDKDARYQHFKETESATARVIRTTCDILGPRGDQKNGCRADWITFCENSKIPSYKSNRFNCFFLAAAAMIHHSSKIRLFFKSGVLPDNVNLKIQSVALDFNDNVLMTFVCALAIFYLKVTGPFWCIVNSKVKYVSFHKCVQSMLSYFEKWSVDSSEMLDADFSPSFCNNINFRTETSLSVYQFVQSVACDRAIILNVLNLLSKEAADVTNRQLSDFLGDGPFAGHVSPAVEDSLRHCPLNNLVGESSFGDYDYDLSKRRNSSLHNRSSIHVVKRNRTLHFLKKKSCLQREKMFRLARKMGPLIRQENRDLESRVKLEIKEKFVLNQQKKIEKEMKDICRNSNVLKAVQGHGGPCESAENVEALLLRFEGCRDKKICDALKSEIRYQNVLAKKRVLKFGTKTFMIDSLKSYFSTRH